MHKLMLKLFGFLKSSAQFMKVVSVFCVLCLLLHWVEHLVHFNWPWLNFIKPLLEFFLNVGNAISDNSILLLGAVFEYKYGIAFILIFTIYYIAHALQISFDVLEDLYSDGRRIVKKMQEDAYNKNLEKQNSLEQEQIKNYQIYVAAYKKRKLSQLASKFNLDDEIKNMNKYLMQKTGINPVKYSDGFLYAFNDFNHIDSVLPYFFKLIHSEAPLDYIICVQILPKEIKNGFEKMSKLINLNIFNQITTQADTVWRYNYNKNNKYKIIQLGLYKKENDTFEVYEFTEI